MGDATTKHELGGIGDLRAAKYNPRAIGRDAAAGLTASLEAFGDLSGIVWNERTGNLVAGHQRVDQLRKRGAVFVPAADGLPPRLELETPRNGRVAWHVRVVDWSLDVEKAANLAANNTAIAGTFTDGVEALFADLRGSMDGDAFAALRFDQLATDLGFVNDAPLPTLPSGERQPFRQMTFTLHDDQYDVVARALASAKAAGAFKGPNSNSNGNALARVAEGYLRDLAKPQT